MSNALPGKEDFNELRNELHFKVIINKFFICGNIRKKELK